MKNTKYNSIKNFIFLTAIVFNIGIFGLVHAASVDTLVDLANSSRSKEGLTSLVINDKLSAAASDKAQDMLKNQYFAHISPDGKTPWDFIKANNYDYAYAGENLSIGYNNDQELHSAWMNSETHRDNIMNKNYDEIGLAIVKGKFEGNETTIVVQMFGQAAPVLVSKNNNQSGNDFQVLGQSSESDSVLFNSQSNNIYNTGLIALLSLGMLACFGYVVYRLKTTHRLT